NRGSDVPLVASADELLIVGIQPLPTDGPYPTDTDASVVKAKVVDRVEPPAPVPPPAPPPVPTPAPPPEPRVPVADVQLTGAPSLSAKFSGRKGVKKGPAYTFKVASRAAAGSAVDVGSLGDGDAT